MKGFSILLASMFGAGYILGTTVTEKEYKHQLAKPTLIETLAEKCIADIAGWSTWLAFNGKDYACLFLDPKHGKIKTFLITLPPPKEKAP